jgi:hypothetical protein
MTVPASMPLWRLFPILQYAQFPWRFLSIPTVCVCLLLPAAWVRAADTRGTETSAKGRQLQISFLFVSLTACFLVSRFNYVRISEIIPYGPERAPENWGKAPVRTTDRDDYGPIWRPGERKETAVPGTVLTDEYVRVLEKTHRGTTMTLRLENTAFTPKSLAVAWNYFPGWRAWAEPELPLTVGPAPKTGFISIDSIRPGKSTLHLSFGDTPLRRNAKVFSAILWLVWIGVGAYFRRESETNCPP